MRLCTVVPDFTKFCRILRVLAFSAKNMNSGLSSLTWRTLRSWFTVKGVRTNARGRECLRMPLRATKTMLLAGYCRKFLRPLSEIFISESLKYSDLTSFDVNQIFLPGSQSDLSAMLGVCPPETSTIVVSFLLSDGRSLKVEHWVEKILKRRLSFADCSWVSLFSVREIFLSIKVKSSTIFVCSLGEGDFTLYSLISAAGMPLMTLPWEPLHGRGSTTNLIRSLNPNNP